MNEIESSFDAWRKLEIFEVFSEVSVSYDLRFPSSHFFEHPNAKDLFK